MTKIDKIRLNQFRDYDKADLNDIIIAVVSLVGIAGLAVVAPNVLRVVGKYQKYRQMYKKQSYVNKRLDNLIKRGLIRINKEEGSNCLELTTTGEAQLEKFKTINRELDKKWDGKWRIVIYDIREKRRQSRDLLRIELQDVGFIKMQNSVWLSPYNCADFIQLIKTDLQLGQTMLFFETDKIENEGYWREKFDLG